MKAFLTDHKTFLLKAYDQGDDWQILAYDMEQNPLKHGETWKTKWSSSDKVKESLICAFESNCKWNGLNFEESEIMFV